MNRLLLLSLLLFLFLLTACPATSTPTPTTPKPTITSFTATPASLPAGGGNVTLKWAVKEATSLSIDGGIGTVTGISKTVNVTSDKTFVLTASNDKGSATQSVNVSVAKTPPPVETFPKITNASVFSSEINNGSCSSLAVSVGATLDLRDRSCDGTTARYLAQVETENPSGETLTYNWTLFITDQDQDFEYLAAIGSSDPSFALRSIYNAGEGTFDCRIIVQVNAPEPSRSKSLAVWQGKCTVNTFTLN